MSTLSRQVKTRKTWPFFLHTIVVRLAPINCTREGACHTYSQVTEPWQSTEMKNAIHFELDTFHTLHIPARPTAFVSAWLHMEIHAF